MQDILTDLTRLDSTTLHARAAEASKRYAVAAWELAACLLAVERSAAFRAFNCASAVEYAEHRLGIGAVKAVRLLAVARVLERFPLLSAACRDGRLCWSKVREIARVVESDTEEAWLEFALRRTAREVERAVAVSPSQFKRERAVAALSCDALPSPRSTASLPDGPDPGAGMPEPPSDQPDISASAGTPQAPPPRTQPPPPPPAPPPPRLVKVELWMTPDQFAVWDQALDRLRCQKKRRVSKEAALEAIARHYLAGGDARTRANHPVVLRVDSTNGTAYYETSRGVVPASADAVEDALARERGSFMAMPNVGAASAEAVEYADVEGRALPNAEHCSKERSQPVVPRRPARRRTLPLRLRRDTLARANYRCQRCGATTGLELDHVDAVCDGGRDANNLQVLCLRCHGHKHADAFDSDRRYVTGRAASLARQRRARESTYTRIHVDAEASPDP